VNSNTARIRAHQSWAKTADRSARTAPAVRGLAAKFLREAREQLGPDATEKQIADAAESARTAFYLDLSAKAHAAKQARRRKGGRGGNAASTDEAAAEKQDARSIGEAAA
jgi:hypothetical protein